MTRWRDPAPESAPYITPAGHAALSQELAGLWDKRAEVTRALAAAAAEGDRSENAEYIYRKKQLREIDRRIGYLQKRIPKLQVVNTVQSNDRVYFGARVTLQDAEGNSVTHRIVGADELAAGPDHISIDSPMARTLLGKGVDDEISITLQEKDHTYLILAINYDTPQAN